MQILAVQVPVTHRLKDACACGRQKGYPFKKWLFYRYWLV